MTDRKLTSRQKAMLTGMFMSKFGREGFRRLGFVTRDEVCNVVGLALGVKPASIKNYRDEFDPLFPNKRKGWHKREPRPDRLEIYDRFGKLELQDFAELILREVIRASAAEDGLPEISRRPRRGGEFFARRLITGQAAEQYFRQVCGDIEAFAALKIRDTTRLGCGFDFCLFSDAVKYGVEVKGLRESSGPIMMTDKEHETAAAMRGDYFLFVAKNLAEAPSHELHRDPLCGKLQFSRVTQRIVQINWTATIS